MVLNDSTVIVDKPRFAYRGLLVDTARHFIPVPILKKQIDSMAYNKLNVLHWLFEFKFNKKKQNFYYFIIGILLMINRFHLS